MQKVLLALVTFLSLISAFAQEGSQSTVMYALDSQGQKHKIRAFVYKNDWNRTEVRLEAGDVPRIAPGVNQVLGYGRDFNDDGKIETWFMWNSEKGFQRYELPGNHIYGYDVVQTRLFKSYQTTLGMKVNVFASNLMTYVSLAASKVVDSQLNFFKEMLDYEEISVRLNRSQGMGLDKLDKLQVARMRLLLREAYRRSYEILRRANREEFLTLAAADVAIWLSGGIVVKYIGKGLKVAGTMVLKTTAGAAVKKVISVMLTRSLAYIATNISRLQTTLGALLTVAQINAVKAMSNLGLKKAIGLVGRGLAVRGKIAFLSRLALKTKKKIGTKWTFTAVSVGAGMWGDLRAESMQKEETSRLVQTLVHSTQMQNAIVSCVNGKKAAKGTEVTYKIGGIVKIKPPKMTVISDESYSDMALDIGTKLTLDNTKDAVDGMALNYVESIVTETGEPKLMLVGYLAIIATELGTADIKRKIQDSMPILCPVKVEAR